MQNIFNLIHSIETDLPNINPTQIYNEGWLSRLLMNQSVKEKIKFGGVDFKAFSKWTSEALISSPFIGKMQNPEGYTHVDLAFGDFVVNYKVSGKLMVEQEAKIFGIIEAKMGSNLSKGTTNFKDYNQAARILACLGSNTCDKNCKIFFIVVAPEAKLNRIKKQIEKENLIKAIINRFGQYDEDFKVNQNMDGLIAKVAICDILAWSYEDWIASITDIDSKKVLNEFYHRTKKWNKINDKDKI